MKDNLNELLRQEMSRKEFLTTLGYGVASLVGLAGLMHVLGHRGIVNGKVQNSNGYGGRAYGN